MMLLRPWLLCVFGIAYGWGDNVIYGPNSPNEWGSWMNKINSQKEKDLSSIGYNGGIYNVSGLKWTQSSFIQPQMHGYDAYFYDVSTHSYTLDKWNDDLIQRYGGIDSMLFWVTYTNIGADDRNQFDLNLAVPGGMEALQSMVKYFHSKGIQVLFPYNPWDTGTRDSGNPDYVTMAQFLNETGADGFNGDTMDNIPEDFYSYSVSKYNHPIGMQPEGGGQLQDMNWDTLGWGEGWNPYPYKPLVAKWKFYDGRFMTDVVNRWAHNRTDDLHNAFFNGIGYVSWENVWGCFNKIVPRDGEAIRRMATILRYFVDFTSSTDWMPYIPIISDEYLWNSLFASLFQLDQGSDKQQVLFLIVNRNNMDIKGANISFENTWTIEKSNIHVYDCYYGQELHPLFNDDDKSISVRVDVEALGYMALLVTYESLSSNADLSNYLQMIRNMTQTPLSTYSAKWTYLEQTMTEIAPTKLYPSPPDAGMVHIPYGIHFYNNMGVEIEGSDNDGVDLQYPWNMSPQREQYQTMTIDAFYVDKYPVTCKEYKQYLDASKYKPRESYNYLKNWNITADGEYVVPDGYENKPVTYLGYNEAKDYCAFYGKRMIHSYEWHYAAQGNTSYLYPWGNDPKMGQNFPITQHGRSIPGPEDVDIYSPQGDSMFGVSDLIGNVWQYTDEFTDAHTRAAVVMGSANYRPSGSMWYFPTAFQLNQHNKYFLMDNTYERCGTIGFRCAADSVQPADRKPMFWPGSGNYCGDNKPNGELCGSINPQMGYNNLSEVGVLDWVQFGTNAKDTSAFKIIRKETATKYIDAVTCNDAVLLYENNINGFYWNDGGSDMPVLDKSDATTDGVYVYKSSINWSVNGLKSGNVYKLKVYVGVYDNQGTMDVNLTIGTNSYRFIDSSMNNGGTKATGNGVYDLIIDLTKVSSGEAVKVSVVWNADKSDGNATLQAIALSLL